MKTIGRMRNLRNITDRLVSKYRKSAGYVSYREFGIMKMKFYALLTIFIASLSLVFVQYASMSEQITEMRGVEQERDMYAGIATEVDELSEQISELEELFNETHMRYVLADAKYERATMLNQSLQFQLNTIRDVISISESSVVADLSDLRILSNASEAQLNILLQNTPLEGKGWYFLMAEREYGVNAIIMISIMRQESDLGRAGSLWRQNNFAGISNGRGGWASFETPKDGVFALARLLGVHYLCEEGRFHNGVSLEAVNVLYAPLSDYRNHGWASGIRSHTAQALDALSG